MNERIKLLAEQADGVFIHKLITGAKQYTFLERDLEKFAQLIVAECGKVIVNGGYRNPALGEKYPLTPPEINKMIKEHFGVEE